MMAVWSIVTVLYRPAVAPDQPWASRRLVPFVLPGLILGATWAATWLKDQAARLDRTKVTRAAVAVCCVASLVIPTALTTLGVSVTRAHGVTVHGMAFRQIGGGELAAVGRLCRSVGRGASVVILDDLTADRFAQVIRGICGEPTAIMTDPTQAKINAVVHGIEVAGRRPVLLAENRAELPGPGRARRRAGRSRQPSHHPGGAQPDRAAHPYLAHPLHGVDEHPRSRRRLVSSPVVSTFPPAPRRRPRWSPSCCPASTSRIMCCSRSSGSAAPWTRAG